MMAESDTTAQIFRNLPQIDSGSAEINNLLTYISDQYSRLGQAFDALDTSVDAAYAPTSPGLAPTNAPSVTGKTTTMQDDASMDVTISWSYSQGAIEAEFFIILWKEGTAPLSDLTTADNAVSVPITSNAFRFEGLNPNNNYRIGIAAGRNAYDGTGIVIGTIVQPTTGAPVVWDDLTLGQPEYVGTIFGREQHNFVITASGNLANPDPGVTLTKDTSLINTGGDSYTLSIYNLATKTFISHTTYDVLNQTAGITDLLSNTGFEDGLTNWDTLSSPGGGDSAAIVQSLKVEGIQALKLTGVSGTFFGRSQTVAAPSAATTYILSAWIRVTSYTGGSVRVSAFNYDGASGNTGGISIGAVTNGWRYYSEEFTKSAGVTSFEIRIFLSNTPDNIQAYYDEIHCYPKEASSQLADAINARTSVHLNDPVNDKSLLMIYTSNDPQPERLTGGLPDAIRRTGGSRTVFSSAAFQPESAYILVGAPWMGEGNGFERYAGEQQSDPSAAVTVQFQTQDDDVVSMSGTGYQPALIPGPATADPDTLGINQTTSASGERQHQLTWAYTQPTLGGSNATADAFIIYYERADTPTADEQQVVVSVNDRAFTFGWSLSNGSVVSYAIATVRYTASGEEVGPKITTGSWQGVTASLYVQSLEPGPPTNDPTGAALTLNTANINGGRTHAIQWSYVQGALPADGFIVYVNLTNTASPTAQQYMVNADITDFIQFWGQNTGANAVASYGVRAFRRTIDGIETSGLLSGGVWQNVSAQNYVQTLDPGPPTNDPTTLAIPVNAALENGGRFHALTWDYTQGALEADGFILRMDTQNTPTPDRIQFLLNADVRRFEYAHGNNPASVVSYAIQAYRRTLDGVELGTLTTIAGWQNVSGHTTTQSFEEGAPTNSPAVSGFTNISLNSGGKLHTCQWTYTHGARPADGFVIYVELSNTTTPNYQQYWLNKDVRQFHQFWGQNSTGVASYGIKAFRRTLDGVELTSLVTNGSWQNNSTVNTIVTAGITPGNVTGGGGGSLATTTVTGGASGNIASNTITEANILSLTAADITTGVLNVDPVSGGATAIYIQDAGKLRMEAAAASPSIISFENTSAVEQFRIEGATAPSLRFIPTTDGVGGLTFGILSSKSWNAISMYSNNGITFQDDTFILLDGTLRTSKMVSTAPTGSTGDPTHRLPIWNSAGVTQYHIWATAA